MSKAIFVSATSCGVIRPVGSFRSVGYVTMCLSFIGSARLKRQNLKRQLFVQFYFNNQALDSRAARPCARRGRRSRPSALAGQDGYALPRLAAPLQRVVRVATERAVSAAVAAVAARNNACAAPNDERSAARRGRKARGYSDRGRP